MDEDGMAEQQREEIARILGIDSGSFYLYPTMHHTGILEISVQDENAKEIANFELDMDDKLTRKK